MLDRLKRSHWWKNAKRALRAGGQWAWVEPEDLQNGIEVAQLVCPLRYDVLVRRDFLMFYAHRRELYVSDFDAFVELARDGMYYTWYMKSEAVRVFPNLRGNREALEAAFRERVRQSADLYESVVRRGFDSAFPIVLRTADRLLPPTTGRGGPPTGKAVSARYFIADGAHRLALLMAFGYRVLPRKLLRVQRFKEFSPFDSTSLLTRALPLDAATYFAYLSSYYCAPHICLTREDVLSHVAAHRPELLPEVSSVIAVDGFAAGDVSPVLAAQQVEA